MWCLGDVALYRGGLAVLEPLNHLWRCSPLQAWKHPWDETKTQQQASLVHSKRCRSVAGLKNNYSSCKISWVFRSWLHIIRHNFLPWCSSAFPHIAPGVCAHKGRCVSWWDVTPMCLGAWAGWLFLGEEMTSWLHFLWPFYCSIISIHGNTTVSFMLVVAST